MVSLVGGLQWTAMDGNGTAMANGSVLAELKGSIRNSGKFLYLILKPLALARTTWRHVNVACENHCIEMWIYVNLAFKSIA